MMPWWGYVLTFIAMMGAALVGVIKLLTGMDHDWRKCTCYDCKRKMYRARIRRGDRVVGAKADGSLVWDEEPQPAKTRAYWISTADLNPRSTVRLNGKGYFVRNIEMDNKGYIVQLISMATQRDVIVTVSHPMAHHRYWEPGDGMAAS